MKNCNFNPEICSIDCKKYQLCSYYNIQEQFSEIQSQLNFIYKNICDILKLNETADLKINLIESAVFNYISKNDSYKKIDKKESNNEKENQ